MDENLRFEAILEDINGKFDIIVEGQNVLTEKVNGLEVRLDGIDDRLDGIDDRLDGIDDRLDKIEDRLDSIEEVITPMINAVDENSLQLSDHENRIVTLERKAA